MVKWIVFFLMCLQALSLAEETSINTSLDNTFIPQNQPIKGTIEITHPDTQEVDPSSFMMQGKSLAADFVKNVKFSPQDPLTVSFYSFELPAQEPGNYTLPEISVRIGGKTYKSFSLSYEVSKVATLAPNQNKDVFLKLEAFIEGVPPIYPGQKLKLIYRYLYKGDIALTEENLPLLDNDDFLKIGQKDIQDTVEGDNVSVRTVSQVVKVTKPGTYKYPSSLLKGIALERNAGGQVIAQTPLNAQTPPAEIEVLPFPKAKQPASFNGSISDSRLTFAVKLSSAAKMRQGDKTTLIVLIQGKNTDWNDIFLPELCCQPGFSGQFKQSDLPPQTEQTEQHKQFLVELELISSEPKFIPEIEFSYFNPQKKSYRTLKSDPIAIEIIQDERQVQEEINPDLSLINPTLDFNTPALILQNPLPLRSQDLINRPFATWQGWIGLPLTIAALLWQTRLKRQRLTFPPPKQTSKKLFKEALKQEPKQYSLFERAFVLKLQELKWISEGLLSAERIPINENTQEVRDFLLALQQQQFSGKTSLSSKQIDQLAEQVFANLEKKSRV